MMKRTLTLLGVFLYLCLLAGCSLISGIELAEPDTGLPQGEEQQPEDAEAPEGSKALTMIFAHEIDEDRTYLLEAAQQVAAEKGYTLTNVNSMGDPVLQSRFLQLARDAGEQAVLLELTDASLAESAVLDAGEMAVIFVDVLPKSGLGKHAVYVGNPEGEGELYLRLTGRTAMRAADNLIRGAAANEETELRISGHKITVPADGVITE